MSVCGHDPYCPGYGPAHDEGRIVGERSLPSRLLEGPLYAGQGLAPETISRAVASHRGETRRVGQVLDDASLPPGGYSAGTHDVMGSVREALDTIRKATNEVVANPADVPRLRESLADLHGVHVIESTLVDPGTVYVIKPGAIKLEPMDPATFTVAATAKRSPMPLDELLALLDEPPEFKVDPATVIKVTDVS